MKELRAAGVSGSCNLFGFTKHQGMGCNWIAVSKN